MTDEPASPHHHTLRERLNAAEAAADEVAAEESGQLGGEVNALAVPFEEVAAAVRAAIHPDRLAAAESRAGEETGAGEEEGSAAPPPPGSVDSAHEGGGRQP